MLSHLAIRNFTTVDALELELQPGLTTITGETGAGKSVLLGALALALGEKGTASLLRDANKSAEISATFSFDQHGPVDRWLNTRELAAEPYVDASSELLIRRVIAASGRSRAYINGSSVNIAELKSLGELLVDLHGQHEHQSLLQKQTHATLLDSFAQHASLLGDTAALAQRWHQLQRRIDELKNHDDERSAARQLLHYQVQELDALAPVPGECTKLEQEQCKLANAETILRDANLALSIETSTDQTPALEQIQQAIQLLRAQLPQLPALANGIELLESASIQAIEACADITTHIDAIEINPERLQAVENRLDALYNTARKHQVQPENLSALHDTLAAQLSAMDNAGNSVEALLDEQRQVLDDYHQCSEKLSKRRRKSAKKLAESVNQKLAELRMDHCHFAIDLTHLDNSTPHAGGNESVEFLIATVPGKPPQALAKIASGGELSRISLAIQVVAAQRDLTPTLIFDEVDVGIGGAVAEVVGNLLRDLAARSQVFCVTHLAQVAVKGEQHLRVSKRVTKNSATTSIEALEGEDRKEELARMLGGLDMTESTLAHAADMLETA